MEENVCQEKKHVREVQESLNQEKKLRAEFENHVKLQSQSVADLEQQRRTLQWKCSSLEDQLGQFLYVEPFIYFGSYNTERLVLLCVADHTKLWSPEQLTLSVLRRQVIVIASCL